MLLNLLDNAIKYTDSGHVQFRAQRITSGEGTDGAGCWLGFEVSDTGCGISDEDCGRLFAPFVQQDPAQPGIGLGLAICIELAALLDGTLELDSQPGEGSCFSFELPVETPADDSAAADGAAETLASMAVPPRIEIDTVLELVETGEIARLQEWCDDLVAGAPEYAAFAQRVREQSGDPARLIVWLNLNHHQAH